MELKNTKKGYFIMAITKFIPTIWSETLYEELDKQYIGVAHCNRDFEGEIKNCGSVVKICGVGTVEVNDYTKDTDMSVPQALSDTVTELVIDKAKYFNFQIDDIDLAQASPKLMNAAMKVAASALADEADRCIFSLSSQAGMRVINSSTTSENITDIILDARTRLYANNVNDGTEIFLEVSPEVAALILKSKLTLSTNNTETLEKGCLGSIAGCKVFVSRNVHAEPSGSGIKHQCFMRTKRAIAFAEQLSEIEAYRPEKRFSDAVKGLHLYGAKVVYPNEFVALDLILNT